MGAWFRGLESLYRLLRGYANRYMISSPVFLPTVACKLRKAKYHIVWKNEKAVQAAAKSNGNGLLPIASIFSTGIFSPWFEQIFNASANYLGKLSTILPLLGGMGTNYYGTRWVRLPPWIATPHRARQHYVTSSYLKLGSTRAFTLLILALLCFLFVLAATLVCI